MAEALSYMRNAKIDILPVYDKDQFIGKVTYEELMNFLNHNGKTGDIYVHKLNFDIGTAMLVIKKTDLDFRSRSTRRRSFSRQFIIGLSSVAAVSLLLMLVTRMFVKQDVTSAEKYMLDIAASGKTMLLMPDGRSIALSEAKSGLVVEDSKLSYNDGMLISYPNQATVNSSLYNERYINMPVYNRQMVLNVPTGGTYHVVLPDGSKVWLNAASSLKFPATFEGASKRLVELHGEAYFEIAKVMLKPKRKGEKERKMPFVVLTRTQEIEVLGTQFNVWAYDNERDIKTTLVEGSVRLKPFIKIGELPDALDPSLLDPLQVDGGKRIYGQAVILKPNQEAVLTGTHTVVKEVDATEAFAWKDGEYIFRNTSLETVMHAITRWYGVEVTYENKKAGSTLLGGAISRSSKINEVLKMLELTANVHFKVEGKRITVVE